MNASDHRITWCLNWGEDAVRGWSACYCVSPDQERGRRERRDGTSDVLYRLHLHHKTGKGWYLAFGIDYLPNHERVTQWHESVADCWREMLTFGVSETTMKRIERVGAVDFSAAKSSALSTAGRWRHELLYSE